MMRARLFVTLLLVSAPLLGCQSLGDTTTSPTTTTATSQVPTVLVLAALSLAVGDSVQVRAVKPQAEGLYEIVTTGGTWQSSDTTIVTVSPAGIVSAVASGTANITLTVGDYTATIPTTVTATSSGVTAYSGVTAGVDTKTGTLQLSIAATPRVSGTLHVGGGQSITLLGTTDGNTHALTLEGGGFSFVGAAADHVATGTLTNPAGASGGFAAIESTHTAVTGYCGTYTSDGTTSLGNPDAGAFSLVIAADGTVAGATVPADASTGPLTFSGRATGNQLNLVTNTGGTVSGTIQNQTATGAFTTTAGGRATFSVKTSACP